MKIREILPTSVSITPNGLIADQLTKDQFDECHTLFFDEILKIKGADISGIDGYGELPPLIVRYQQGRMQCIAEQKNFFLGLKQSGRNAYPAIILIPDKADNQKFRELFGNVLFYLEINDLDTMQ